MDGVELFTRSRRPRDSLGQQRQYCRCCGHFDRREITASGINVEQARVADLDPTFDLGDMKVTTAVHDLSPSQRKDALDRGACSGSRYVFQWAY